MSDPPTDPQLPERSPVREHTLDPDRAIAEAGGVPPDRPEQPDVDPRRYRWMIGIFGLVLVLAGSVYGFTKLGLNGPGVAPGRQLHYFVAPLATGPLNGDANIKPRCDVRHPNLQALNVCGRTPLVLAFFVTASGTCRRAVDALQAVARSTPAGAAQFAAVAVRATRSATAKLVRSHHWTIPVAYDRDGAVGAVYGVEICPMFELAQTGGTVRERLIGSRWSSVPLLRARVRALLGR